MGEALLTRRGGSGSGKAFAVIHVEYPKNNTCICTNGTKTLKAKDTSGLVNFLIPEAGTWIVSCSDGSNSKSTSVNITTEGQGVNVTLSYELVLFDNGNYAPETGGWSDIVGGKLSKTHGANFNMSGSNTWACITEDTIDLTGYTKLKFVVDSYSPAWYPVCEFGVGTNRYSQIASVDLDYIGGSGEAVVGEHELDISNLTGEHYVLMRIGGASRYNETADGMTSITMSKVWLAGGNSGNSGGSGDPGNTDIVITGATITPIN